MTDEKLTVPISISNPDQSDLSLPVALSYIVLVAVDLRPGIVATGPLLASIQAEFGLTHTVASLLTAIPDFLMGILALPTPWLANRFGRDRVILMALILLFAAMVARAFAPSIGILLLTTAGVGGGIAIAGALMAGFIKASFPTRAAFMMGIYATALSFGSTVSAALTGPVAVAKGWRFGSGMWSLLGLLAISAWFFTESRARQARGTQRIPKQFALPLRNPTAWLIALFFACDNFLFYAYLSWTAPLYREHGFSAATSGLVLASFTAAFMVANPIFGLLSKHEDRRGLLALSAVIALIGLVGLAISPDSRPFLCIALVAFGLGGAFTLGMTLPLDNTRGPEEATVWNAFVLTVGYLVAAGGPLMVGALRDITGAFSVPLWVLVGVGGIMLGLTPFLKPYQSK